MVVSRCPGVVWQFQTPIRFPAVKQGLILEWEAERCTNLKELNVRKPLVVSISQRSEELKTLQPSLEFDNFKPRHKISIFNASPVWTVQGVIIGVFCQREFRHLFSVFTSIVHVWNAENSTFFLHKNQGEPENNQLLLLNSWSETSHEKLH